MKKPSSHNAQQRRRRGRFTAQVVASWVATLLVAAWAFAPQPSAASTGEPFTVEGTLPVPSTMTNVSSVAVDNRAGILYEIGSFVGGASGVQVVDAATHTLRGQPIVLPDQNGVTPNPPQFAVDEQDHLLFLWSNWSLGFAKFTSGIFVLDGRRRMLVNSAPITPTVQGGTAGLQLFNAAGATMSYDPQSRRLYVLGVLNEPSAPNALITPWYLAAIDPFTATQSWDFLLAGCELPVQGPLGQIPVARDDAVWVMCASPITTPLTEQPELTQGLFRVQLTNGQPPSATPPGTGITIYPVPGLYGSNGGAAIGDQAGGRFVFISPRPGPVEAAAFDVGSRRFVGLMGINGNATPQSACVDGDSGRFYVAAPDQVDTFLPTSQDYGFLVGEARATGSPYPQVRGYPGWLGFPGKNPFSVMACDGAHHQIVVRGQDHVLYLIRDNVPAATPPPPPADPDLATTGGPYDPATSPLAFEGDGRAFGAQVKLVGGYNALLSADLGAGVTNLVPSNPFVASPSSASPALTFGATGLPASPQGVTLSDTQSTSASQGVARDGGLQADISLPGSALNSLRSQGPSGSPPPPDALLDPWAYPILACAASPGGSAKSDSGTGAAVKCDPASDTSAASAEASPFEIPGVVRVVGTGSSVISQLDRKTGTLTTVSEAWAKTISLGDGQVEIDNAVATATAQAAGQAGKAKGTYKRSIGRLLIGGQQICAPCDPEQVAAAVNNNAFTQPTLRLVVPEPAGAPKDNADHTSYDLPATPGGAVTPGGAQASVTRNADEQLEDQSINELSPYDQEVPALRLELQNNTFKHVDLIADFAAPQAYSRVDILPSLPQPPPDETTTTSIASSTSNGDSGAAAGAAAADTPPSDTGGGNDTAPPAPEEAHGPPPGAVGFSPSSSSTDTGSSDSSSPAASAVTPSSGAPYGSSSIGSAPAATGLPGSLPAAVSQLGRGLRAALTSPTKFFELLLVWMVMAIPVYLVARRRLVVDYILAPTQEIQ